MLNKAMYSCRVCGLIQDEPPWGSDGRTPSFEICDCCGVEFGYEDCNVEVVRNFRKKWIEEGCKWNFPKKKPTHWNCEEQSTNIPKEYL